MKCDKQHDTNNASKRNPTSSMTSTVVAALARRLASRDSQPALWRSCIPLLTQLTHLSVSSMGQLRHSTQPMASVSSLHIDSTGPFAPWLFEDPNLAMEEQELLPDQGMLQLPAAAGAAAAAAAAQNDQPAVGDDEPGERNGGYRPAQ